jgi:hypothetical protein
MPNEFVARNGVIAQNNSIVSGSLTVTQGITGSLFGTASWANNASTSSYVLNAVSASFASTASFAPNIYNTNGTLTGNRILSLGGSSLTFSGSTAANSAVLFSNGNMAIGSVTDGGFKLDISGSSTAGLSLRLSSTNFGQNNVLRMQNVPGSANIIQFINTDGTAQGSFLAGGSGFTYGTYRSNQVNLSGGSGGIGLRVNNGANANITFYGTNSDGDFSTAQFQMFGPTGNVQLQNGGTFTDIASARLAINSTTQGFLPPRMTTTQRNAISAPAQALILYNTTTDRLTYRDATTWQEVQTATEITNNIAPAVALFNYYNFY